MPSPRAVLLIDDDADTSVPAILRSAGYEVSLAPDGLRGLEMAARLRPALVIVDLVLPEMDGWEVIRRLRRGDSTAEAAVIALSGHSDKEFVEEAWAAGCDAYLCKPCAPESLLAAVARVLAERGR